jgi:ABC-type Fe3+/spermidine/putrescine transport system ATPase subunit
VVESNAPNLRCANVGFADVLHDVSLDVARGRCTALLGPSGAGKTTLLWILAGLLTPDGGRLERGAGRIGMVFQGLGLWNHLTVERHLDVVGATPSARERLLERMDLASLRQRRPAALSGGERQRLAIARALAVEPDWLLLDEPMAHLDGTAREDLFDLLREALASVTGAGVLIATHHAGEAMRLADDLAVLIEGRVVQRGTPEEVYRAPASLDAARALGPASLLDGRIVRPEDIAFLPDADGSSRVARCAFVGAAYLLRVVAGGDDATTVTCRSEIEITPGTRGRVADVERSGPPG